MEFLGFWILRALVLHLSSLLWSLNESSVESSLDSVSFLFDSDFDSDWDSDWDSDSVVDSDDGGDNDSERRRRAALIRAFKLFNVSATQAHDRLTCLALPAGPETMPTQKTHTAKTHHELTCGQVHVARERAHHEADCECREVSE